MLFVVFLHRRLGHVLLDGLVRLPGLMRTNKDIVTVGDPIPDRAENRSRKVWSGGSSSGRRYLRGC